MMIDRAGFGYFPFTPMLTLSKLYLELAAFFQGWWGVRLSSSSFCYPGSIRVGCDLDTFLGDRTCEWGHSIGISYSNVWALSTTARIDLSLKRLLYERLPRVFWANWCPLLYLTFEIPTADKTKQSLQKKVKISLKIISAVTMSDFTDFAI